MKPVPKMMRDGKTRGFVLVSGGSGMLGTALRERLALVGMPVRQLVRHKPTAAGQIHWDPTATPAVADASEFEGYAAVVHLSGANVAGHRWTAAYRREIASSRVDSTRSLATLLAKREHRPEVLIVASAIGIYGDRGDEVLEETARPGAGFLPEVCTLWEEAAKPAEDAGIRVVHTRFGVVLDAKSGALAKMLPLFRLGLGGKLGSGRQWMSWVSLDDVVRAILFALETRAIAGAVNVTAPHPETNADLTRALAHELKRPALLPVPAFALRLALGKMADEALLASARVVPAKLEAAGFRFAHPSLEEGLKAALR